jgi:hypothetical protein
VPKIRVVLQRAGTSPVAAGRRSTDVAISKFTIRADEVNGGIGVESRTQEISFDATGLSPPLEFQLTGPLPSSIGRTRLTWKWIVEDELPDPSTPIIGLSDHDLYTVWRTPKEPSTWQKAQPGDPDVWAYLPVVAWTCEWAAGVDGRKQICDAIIANVHKSGLKYGLSAHSVRSILKSGGGMCGGWYKLFQAMVGCQGVEVLRRSFLVNWPKKTEETRWCALVVRAPGLNQHVPTFDLTLFHDLERPPSSEARTEPTNTIERRYRFWGTPYAKTHDGHCINYLDCAEGKFLYDACFLDHPIEVDVIPEVNLDTPTPVHSVGNFKTAYLDKCVDFMLGSLKNGEDLFSTVLPGLYDGKRRWRGDGHGGQVDLLNGLTVETSNIPADHIDFYWGE